MYEENDLYAALGVEPDGEKEQESAEPAQELTIEAESQKDPEAAETGESGNDPDEEAKRRHENAARRRQQQLAELERQADERAQKKTDEAIKNLGQTNPYTGKTIETLAELQQLQRDQKDADIQRNLKAGKLTLDAISKAIEDNPILQKAQKVLDDAEEAKRQARVVQETAAREAFQAQVDKELASIAAINPKIKSVEDILAMPTGGKFAKLVKENNLSFEDAYKLANIDEVRKLGEAAAAAQSQQRGGKGHLQGTNQRGEGSIPVPDDIKQSYRMFNPGITDEEIAADYNDFIKKQKE